jgi:hypothetical protein
MQHTQPLRQQGGLHGEKQAGMCGSPFLTAWITAFVSSCGKASQLIINCCTKIERACLQQRDMQFLQLPLPTPSTQINCSTVAEG